LTLGKIIKIVATRCQILRLKCTKFNFGWGSAPDHAGGAYSAPPDPLAGLSGPTSKGKRGYGKGRKGERDGMGRGREETVREGEGRGGEVRGDEGRLGDGRGRDPPPSPPSNPYFWIRPCTLFEVSPKIRYSGASSRYCCYRNHTAGSKPI